MIDRHLQQAIEREMRGANDPLFRIPFQEILDFSRHWTPGHDQTSCDQCIRFALFLHAAGGIVVDPDTGEGTLHPQLLELIDVAAGRVAGSSHHTDHVHVHMGASTSPPPVGDVLDSVAEDGSLRCACGCRALITDDSPSAYYASANCQAKVMQGYATNPQEVYSGTDAHYLLSEDIAAAEAEHRAAVDRGGRMFVAPAGAAEPTDAVLALPTDWQEIGWTPSTGWPVDAQSALEWLQALRPVWVAGRAPRDRAEVDTTARTVLVTVPPQPYESLLDYTRQCPACRDWTRPYTVAGPVEAGDRISVVMMNPGQNFTGRRLVRQECGTCRYRIPGRLYFGASFPHPTRPGTWRLILQDGISEAARDLDVGGLTPQQVRADAARACWHRLEERLERFASSWRPQDPPGSTPVPAGQNPYQIDVPPPPFRRGRRA